MKKQLIGLSLSIFLFILISFVGYIYFRSGIEFSQSKCFFPRNLIIHPEADKVVKRIEYTNENILYEEVYDSRLKLLEVNQNFGIGWIESISFIQYDDDCIVDNIKYNLKDIR